MGCLRKQPGDPDRQTGAQQVAARRDVVQPGYKRVVAGLRHFIGMEDAPEQKTS